MTGVQTCALPICVSMDLITVDVSSLASVNKGMWVEIMGPQISVDMVATKANTIGYECLTRLGARMERVIV